MDLGLWGEEALMTWRIEVNEDVLREVVGEAVDRVGWLDFLQYAEPRVTRRRANRGLNRIGVELLTDPGAR